jgi:glycosyltransferase involved in cell wall biosynthesis
MVEDIELTILMPCLDEAATVARCVARARDYLALQAGSGEVLVADNGSTDGSRELAMAAGARVVLVAAPGYGAALMGGIDAARGRFVIMGDADESYDFSRLDPFVERLREGADIVMGNRFRGGIAPGAMPASHRYVGNPVLSLIGRVFFRVQVGDFHCGLRGFRRDRVQALRLTTTGMEFASEMIVRAALAGYRIDEVPTTLSKDGRARPPHLRTWHDGWRHLRFLLVYSPRWLFLYPGLVLMLLGLTGVLLLFPGEFRVGRIAIDANSFVASCMVLLIGAQTITFGVVARRYATRARLLPPSRYGVFEKLTPDLLLVSAVALSAVAIVGVMWCVWQWASVDFGPLPDPRVLRALTLSFTGLALGVQLGMTAFLSGIMDLPQRAAPHDDAPVERDPQT